MRPPEPSAESEISKLYMTVLINQDIIRFNVPMDESHLVNTVDCTDKLADVKPEKDECKIIFINK